MFQCDAIIFDLDGVLVDSNQIVERHFIAWAQSRNLPFDRFSADHHGLTTIETIRRVAPHLDAVAEAMILETAEGDDKEGLLVYPGAVRLLSGLPKERWAIATSGTRRTATTRITHVGLPEPSVLVTADDVRNGKPAPDPYLLAAERLGVSASRCLVIEDAPAGVRSARTAGARVIAVTTTNSAAALVAADFVIATLDDLRIEMSDRGLSVFLRGST
jgi:mannitol-1-/sugar-/sorbitol-6-phosphatase